MLQIILCQYWNSSNTNSRGASRPPSAPPPRTVADNHHWICTCIGYPNQVVCPNFTIALKKYGPFLSGTYFGPIWARSIIFDKTELIISQLVSIRSSRNLKQKLNGPWGTHSNHDQGHQHQSGTSSILQTSSNVIYLWDCSWCLQTQKISTKF